MCIIVSVQNNPIKRSPVQNVPHNYLMSKRTVPYKTVPQIFQKIVRKTISLIEVIIVPQYNLKNFARIKTFWFYVIWMIIRSLAENI